MASARPGEAAARCAVSAAAGAAAGVAVALRSRFGGTSATWRSCWRCRRAASSDESPILGEAGHCPSSRSGSRRSRSRSFNIDELLEPGEPSPLVERVWQQTDEKLGGSAHGAAAASAADVSSSASAPDARPRPGALSAHADGAAASDGGLAASADSAAAVPSAGASSAAASAASPRASPRAATSAAGAGPVAEAAAACDGGSGSPARGRAASPVLGGGCAACPAHHVDDPSGFDFRSTLEALEPVTTWANDCCSLRSSRSSPVTLLATPTGSAASIAAPPPAARERHGAAPALLTEGGPVATPVRRSRRDACELRSAAARPPVRVRSRPPPALRLCRQPPLAAAAEEVELVAGPQPHPRDRVSLPPAPAQPAAGAFGDVAAADGPRLTSLLCRWILGLPAAAPDGPPAAEPSGGRPCGSPGAPPAPAASAPSEPSAARPRGGGGDQPGGGRPRSAQRAVCAQAGPQASTAPAGPAECASEHARQIVREARRFQVDNGQLRARARGLKFRLSKSLEDADREAPTLLWGAIVAGTDEGDGWLKVGDRFLPMRVHGKPVLTLQLEEPGAESRHRLARSQARLSSSKAAGGGA
ncbi:unnamed protein product [Prorocentrum cordatum]|uniref:Uncharacterized protein n=1 Tax=Prorocentrum cordatum TaxID=2364126 RepID=A0ABN9VR83_9DINO|nr:unnamed protein product [Polarella glacialis]